MSAFLIARLPSRIKSLEAVEFMQKNNFFFHISSNAQFLNLLTSSEGAGESFSAAFGLPDEFKLGDEEKRLIQQFAVIEVKDEVDSGNEYQLKKSVDAAEVKEEVISDVEKDDIRATEEGDSHGTEVPASPLICRSKVQPAAVQSTVAEQAVEDVLVEPALGEAQEEHEGENSLGEKEEDEQRMEGGEKREMAVDDLLEAADAGDSMMSIDPIHDDHSLAFDASIEEDLLEQETAQSTNCTEPVVKEENDVSESVLETPPVAVETAEPAGAPVDDSMSLETNEEDFDDKDAEGNGNMEDFEEEEEEELVEEEEHENDKQEEESDEDVGVDDADGEETKSSKKRGFIKTPGTPVARLLFACLAKNCSASYNTFKELEDHMESHLGKQDFFCDVCQTNFSSKDDAMTHIHRRLDKECCGCGKKLSLPYRLLRHLRCHTGEKPFVCHACGSGFTQLDNLKIHMLTHTGEKPFSCGLCKKRFTYKQAVKEHERTHTEEKPYECSNCEYKCNNASNLKTHMRIHTGEKPYSCGYCEKRFSRTYILKNHELTHTGEKPFECKDCGRRFAQRSSLATHIRIHTGLKPYSCEKCDKKFTRNFYLKDHMKKMHTS